MKDNHVECLFSRLFLNNGIIITFISKINFKNVIIFPSESMKRACSNNKSKQTEKRICHEPATIIYVFYTIMKILMIVTSSLL